MSHISLSVKSYKNGITVTRKIIVPKNKYSEYYKEHKDRMKNKLYYTIDKYESLHKL